MKIEDWNFVCILFIQNEIQWYAYVRINPPRAVKRPLREAEGPTFLFIKIESWNLIRTYGKKWYAYMQVDPHMDRKTALLEGRRPHLFKTFLFIKIEDWNLVGILFLQNEIQWYAYVWVSAPQGRETALAWVRWPYFLVYQDKKLKFGTNIWRIMIRIHVDWLSYGPQNGPFRELKPLPPPLPIFKTFLLSR